MTSIIRTGLISLVCGGLVLGVYWHLAGAWRDRAIAEQERIIAEMEDRLAQKDAMLERLARGRRIAHIEILDQTPGPLGTVQWTTLRFIELDDDGRELARRDFTIPGAVLFIDAWTAKFEHGEVAAGNPMRGRTLVLLRRIYSEAMPPQDGFAIDTPGGVPPGYAATEIADFERMVWKHFWEVATDPETASRFGVRVAQGEVVYKPVRAGQRYELSVDAAGGINLTPRVARTAGPS